MRFDDRRGACPPSALLRRSRQALFTPKVQLLARLEHRHARGLAVSERRGEDWRASFHVTSPCSMSWRKWSSKNLVSWLPLLSRSTPPLRRWILVRLAP